MATNVNEMERLTELLGRWVKACGVYRVATVIPYGGSLWRCDFCNAESHEGPDRVPHTPTCLVGQTERVLVGGEGDKEARDGESSGGTAGTATDV